MKSAKNTISRGCQKDSTGKLFYDVFFLMLNFAKSIVYKQNPDSH